MEYSNNIIIAKITTFVNSPYGLLRIAEDSKNHQLGHQLELYLDLFCCRVFGLSQIHA